MVEKTVNLFNTVINTYYSSSPPNTVSLVEFDPGLVSQENLCRQALFSSWASFQLEVQGFCRLHGPVWDSAGPQAAPVSNFSVHLPWLHR